MIDKLCHKNVMATLSQHVKIPTCPVLSPSMLGDSLPIASQPTCTQTESAKSSLRRSLRANQQDSLHLHRSSLGTDLLKDQLTKVRPALTPTLFTQNDEVSGEDPFSKPLKHTALMEKLQQIYKEAETAESGGGIHSSDHNEVLTHGCEANEKEVFQQRLKFKKKLMSGSKPGKDVKSKKTHGDSNPNGRKTAAPAQPSPLVVSLSTAITSSNQTSMLTSSKHKAPQHESMAPLLPQSNMHFPTENKNTPGIYSGVAYSFKIFVGIKW